MSISVDASRSIEHSVVHSRLKNSDKNCILVSDRRKKFSLSTPIADIDRLSRVMV